MKTYHEQLLLHLERKYGVVSVWELKPDMGDYKVVELAVKESRIIVTYDKDLGRIVLLESSKVRRTFRYCF